MKNQIHFRSEKEVINWLLGTVNSKEEYESLLSDLARIESDGLKGGIER